MPKAKLRPKAPEGCWWKKGRIYTRDPRHENRQTSLGTADVEEARALRAKWIAEAFATKHGFTERAAEIRAATLADAVGDFLREKAHKKSLADDRERLARAVEYFGDQALPSITRRDIVAFLGELRNKNGEPVALATRNRYRAVLRTCFELAKANGLVSVNPVATVEAPRERNRRTRVISPEEYRALRDAADPELRAAIVVAYWTAMRLGEILTIPPRPTERIVHLGRTKSGEPRTVPLAPEAFEALQSLEGWTSKVGDVSKRFGTKCTRLGIEDARFHDLRGTAVTRFVEAGIDVVTVQTISGHETLEMLARYVKVSRDRQLEAVGAVIARDAEASSPER